jgi:hypothetical protein
MPNLDESGFDNHVGADVILRTSGLRGTATVHEPASQGMRAAENTTEQFLRALADADMSEQLTVEISSTEETGGSDGTRAGGGGTAIEVEVPAPGTGFGQIMLYAAEDGTLTWHLPDDVPRSVEEVRTRGGVRRTYRIPRAVPPLASQSAGQRGLIGAAGSKLLKLLLFPLQDAFGKIGEHYLARWEKKNRPNRLRSFGPDVYARADAVAEPDWDRIAGGPALLFIHGTASQCHSGFQSIPLDLMHSLHTRYGERVFAYDHHTLSMSPKENAAWLAAHLPERLPPTVDIVAHSRGGLVARTIFDHGADFGLDTRLRVRRLIMVATPNAGTTLADPQHLERFMNRLTNIAQLIPGTSVTDVVALVLTVLKHVAIGVFEELEGLTAMDPDGAFLTRYLNPAGADLAAVSTGYRTVASDFEPRKNSPLWNVLRDGATDAYFGDVRNDLVVPTAGVASIPGLASFAPAEQLTFAAGQGVDHSGYWPQADFRHRILQWLPEYIDN